MKGAATSNGGSLSFARNKNFSVKAREKFA
jgi:hypothetical protein